MKISNFNITEKLFATTLTILLIYEFVALTGEYLGTSDLLTLILSLCFGAISIIFIIVDMIVFSSKTIINENGIIYKTIFKKRFFSWDNIKFISSYEVTIRYTQSKGIICSFNLEKDEIKYIHFSRSFSVKHYYCFPYSEETVNYIISNSPSNKYIGLGFTDKNFEQN